MALHPRASPPRRLPGLVIGGTGSNAGKTVFTLALLAALRRRGFAVQAAKAGPDYIDTAFHAAATGRPAANLDPWMCREAAPGAAPGRPLPAGLRRLLGRMAKDAPDLLAVEGAMGLFDGGHRGAGSAGLLASRLGLPVLLVINSAGLGQSVAAVAEGFLRHRPGWLGPAPLRFLGMVCTHVGGGRHADLLRQALSPAARAHDAPLLGLLPRQGAPALPSRHLGLVEARDALPLLDLDGLARWLEAHCRLDLLLCRLGLAPHAGSRPLGDADPPAAAPKAAQKAPQSRPLPSAADLEGAPPARFFPARRPPRRAAPLVGMAWDEAFSFCYADLPALLGELGARVAIFSPLRDAAPPPGCAGLYFPGGYPELHAAALAANRPMRETLRRLAADGMPVYGECGGYIYLMRHVRVGGRVHAMSGLLPCACTLGAQRAALGYRAALALPGWQQPPDAARPLWVRGHEFHYAREDAAPPPETAVWRLFDSQGRHVRDDGCRQGRVAGTWLHCCPEGGRRFWRLWLRGLGGRD